MLQRHQHRLCTDCARCPCFQPLEFTVLDGRTLQLNTTFISGKAAGLRYAFHDYPTMLVFDADGRPAPPFNVSVAGLANVTVALGALRVAGLDTMEALQLLEPVDTDAAALRFDWGACRSWLLLGARGCDSWPSPASWQRIRAAL